MGFPGGSVVNNLSANAEDTGDAVSFLGREDPLKEEMATPVFLPVKERSMGLQKSDKTETLSTAHNETFKLK